MKNMLEYSLKERAHLICRKDVITLPRDFPFAFYNSEVRAGREPVLHFHDCLEINYIEEGSGRNIIEDKQYDLKSGDFYIINNLEHHYAFTDSSLRMKIIVFDPRFIWQNNSFDYEYLTPFYKRNIRFSNCVKKENPLSSELTSIITEIESEWAEKQEGYRMIIKALLMKLLGVFYRYFKSNDELGEDIKAFQKSYDRIRDVIEYINDNYEKDLTLDDLSKVILMNKTYFSTYFKKIMGMNVSDYIEKIRVDSACNLLRTTNASIIDISMKSGFNNVTHFNRIFKKHTGYTPTGFRNSK